MSPSHSPSIKIESEEVLVSGELEAQVRTALNTVLAREDLGFLRLPSKENLISASELRAREVSRQCNHLVVLGMGGSSLGGRALLGAVPKAPGRGSVTFIDNIDSDHFWTWMRSRYDLDSIHWLIVSKSGNTMETLCLADLVDQHLRASGHRRLSTVSTVVSELKDNPLTAWARKESVPQLEIPVDVGGRFSVLSPVGLMPAAFSGLRLDHLAEGALAALAQNGGRDLIARIAAQSLASFARGEWITMLWSYSDGLREFGLWWQQLWAESLAKKLNRKGSPALRASTPVPAIGANDQHSLLQQVMEGERDKFCFFQRVSQCEESGPKIEKSLFTGQEFTLGKGLGDLYRAECEATIEALKQVGVKSSTLTVPALDEHTMGELFMTWEVVIATMGEWMNINAFDQPGVELGKQLARSKMRR